MIIKKIEDISNTEKDVNWGNGKSKRFLTKSDNLPYTITETTVNANTESKLQYLNHTEACYCVEGEGEIECNGKVYEIKKGIMYIPEKDKHILRTKNNNLKLICVFSPPLEGSEHHKLSNDGYSTYE